MTRQSASHVSEHAAKLVSTPGVGCILVCDSGLRNDDPSVQCPVQVFGCLCRLPTANADPEAACPTAQSPEAHPSLSPGSAPQQPSSTQPLWVPSSHMGSELIGAVHLPGFISHSISHMDYLPHHMSHVQSCTSAPMTQPTGSPQLEGADPDSKVGVAFGLSSYIETSASSKLQESSAWNQQVICEQVLTHHNHDRAAIIPKPTQALKDIPEHPHITSLQGGHTSSCQAGRMRLPCIGCSAGHD